MLRAKVDFLKMAALAQIPDVKPMAVVAFDQALQAEPVLEHVGRAPFAADSDVVADVPPEVVGEKLRAAVDFPLAEHVETFVIEQEDSSGAAAVRAAHGAHVNRVGAAMERMRTAVAGARRDLFGLDHFDDLRRARVGLGVDHVDARGAEARHQ